MKKILSAAVLATGLVFAGSAFADTMDATYGNTVTLTMADGTAIHYHMDADGTYSMITPEGTVTGAWHTSGSDICLTPAGGEEGCTPLAEGKNVGDTWTAMSTEGDEISLTITEGR